MRNHAAPARITRRLLALPILSLLLLTLCCNELPAEGGASSGASSAGASESSAVDSPALNPSASAGQDEGMAAASGKVVHSPPSAKLPLAQVKLPPGFRIGMFAENLNNARSLAVGEKGTVFVGNRENGGSVYALRDNDGDGAAEERYTIASGLFMPNGVAVKDGALYVGEVNKVWRIDNIEDNLASPGKPIAVRSDFPSETHHGWKYIAFGPDGLLYIPVGAPCNVCEEGDPFATIMRMGADGSNLEVVARGVRNTVGFDWHPQTGELWFTDNGRDMLGDDIPPDELNRLPSGSSAGAQAPHFGFPHWHGRTVSDPEYGKGRTAAEFELPARELDAHVAALGMKFYDGSQFPAEYRNMAFVAEHGSWNRSKKIGYRVMLARIDASGNVAAYEGFATGFKQGENVWGRPVDVLVLHDGSLLVSDDYANCVYRITYEAGS